MNDELIAVWDNDRRRWWFAVEQADLDTYRGSADTFAVPVTDEPTRRLVHSLISSLRGVETATERLIQATALEHDAPRRTYPCSRWIGASGRAPGSNCRLPETSCPRCGWARAAHAQALTADGLVRQQGRGAA
jgi:hypothetical protein